MGKAKTLAAGGVLVLALAAAGCGGSNVEGEYEGALQDPDGPEQIAVTLEIEERDDGSLRAQMSAAGEDGSARLTGPEPSNGQFELTAESGVPGGDIIVDGEVDGDDLEADFISGGGSGTLTAERQ